jgi:O-antigen/teichoic acid export membrane protein
VSGLLAGLGVVAVSVAYLLAAALGFAVGIALLTRHVGRLPLRFPLDARRDLRRKAIPFAAQEVLSAGLARVDAILLSLLAAQAVVGLYGAAYRLLEATLFLSVAVQGAFAAMYTYLDEHSDPTISAAFSRSIKLALVLLAPCAVTLAVIPGPVLELFYGSDFVAGSTALRLLAPVVVLLGVVLLCVSLISSRLDPKILIGYFGVTLAVNLALNAALIPSLGATGAAIGMLGAELVLCALALRTCLRAVGGVDPVVTAGAPLIAAAAMAAVLALLEGIPAVPALAVAGVAYAGAFAAAEHRLAPSDLAFVTDMVRSRMPSRTAQTLPTDQVEER